MGVGEGDDRDWREKDRETGAGEREIGRETGWERERGKREEVTGEKEKKIRNTKKFMEFHLVVLQSGYQRQGGKEKDRKRDGLGERERERKI